LILQTHINLSLGSVAKVARPACSNSSGASKFSMPSTTLTLQEAQLPVLHANKIEHLPSSSAKREPSGTSTVALSFFTSTCAISINR
jgi:hypothetical protein